MCTDAIVDALSQAEYDIVPVKRGDRPSDHEIDEPLTFLEHLPSEETFDMILAKVIPDILWYDCGAVTKVFPVGSFDEGGNMIPDPGPPVDLHAIDGRSILIEAPPVGNRYKRFWQYSWMCLDENTRTLTENGFKYYWEWQKGEKIASVNPNNHEIEYIEPVEINIYDVTNIEMHHYSSRAVDVLVSPNHKMYYSFGRNIDKNWKLGASEEITSERIYFLKQMGWQGIAQSEVIVPTVEYEHRTDIKNEEKHIPIDIWLDFLGYYISEGSVRVRMDELHNYGVIISQMPGEKADKIRDCLAKMPYIWREESRASDGYITFKTHNKSLAKYLQPLGNKYQKYIPKEIKSLPANKLTILLDALVLGDGRTERRGLLKEYFTASTKLGEDVAEVMMKLGYAVGIRKTGNVYTITGYKNKVSYYQELRLSKHRTTEWYTGTLYCFELPKNHLFITERNGKIGVHGNSPTSLPTPFDVREMIYIQQRPSSRGVYGTSALEIIQHTVNYLLDSTLATSKYWENGIHIGGQIDFPNVEDADELKKRAKMIKEDLQGSHRYNKWMVTNGNVKITPLQFTPQQMQWLDSQKWFSKIVMGIFKVAPSELGFTEDLNRSTGIQQMNIYKSKALYPLMKRIERVINRQLIWNDFSPRVKFQFRREMDYEDQIKQLEIYSMKVNNNFWSVNQVRTDMGLDAWEPAFDQPSLLAQRELQPAIPEIFRNEGMGSEQQSKEDTQKGLLVGTLSGQPGFSFSPRVWDGQMIDRFTSPQRKKLQETIQRAAEEDRKRVVDELKRRYALDYQVK